MNVWAEIKNKPNLGYVAALYLLFVCITLDFFFDAIGTHVLYIDEAPWTRMWFMPQSETFRTSEGFIPFPLSPFMYGVYKSLGFNAFVWCMWTLQVLGLSLFAFKHGGNTGRGVFLWGLAGYVCWPFMSTVTPITWAIATFGWVGAWVTQPTGSRLKGWLKFILIAAQLPVTWVAACAKIKRHPPLWWGFAGGVILALTLNDRAPALFWWWVKSFGGFYANASLLLSVGLSVCGTVLCVVAYRANPEKSKPLLLVALAFMAFFLLSHHQLGRPPFAAIHKIGFSSLVVLALIIQAPLRKRWSALRSAWLLVVALVSWTWGPELPVPSWRSVMNVEEADQGFLALKSSAGERVPYYANPTKNATCVLVTSGQPTKGVEQWAPGGHNVWHRRVNESCASLATKPTEVLNEPTGVGPLDHNETARQE